MLNAVERRGQVRIQRPHPLGHPAFAGHVDRLNSVLAAAARPEPVGSGLEPGLPLRFQRVTDPALMTAIRNHRNTERPQLRAVTRPRHGGDRSRTLTRNHITGISQPPSPTDSLLTCDLTSQAYRMHPSYARNHP